MKIWAHRGCSQRYPENTLLSFENATRINGLEGIELDIQLTSDNYMVVCHDERVDRTTDGTGNINSFTLAELKKLKINAGENGFEHIPTINEVLDLIQDKIMLGMKLNIELKNSNILYEGMEEMIIDLVHKRGIAENVIYSSFSGKSVNRIKEIDPSAHTGILDGSASNCLKIIEDGCTADALHPYWKSIDLPAEMMSGYPVRAWFAGHLYPEKPTGKKLDLNKLEAMGVTDVFLNEPEIYL